MSALIIKMPKCPRDKTDLVKRGISFVCLHCDYKIIDPAKKWVPPDRMEKTYGNATDFGTCALTGCEIYGNTVVVSSGCDNGLLVTPQFTNLNVNTDERRYVTIVRMKWDITGKIDFYVSNDAGKNYYIVYDQTSGKNSHDAKKFLPDGTFDRQVKYWDLRVKALLESGAVLKSFTVYHNYEKR